VTLIDSALMDLLDMGVVVIYEHKRRPEKIKTILFNCADLDRLFGQLKHCEECHSETSDEPMRERSFKMDGYEVVVTYCCEYEPVVDRLSAVQIKRMIAEALLNADTCSMCKGKFYTTELATLYCPECLEDLMVDFWAMSHGNDASTSFADIMARALVWTV